MRKVLGAKNLNAIFVGWWIDAQVWVCLWRTGWNENQTKRYLGCPGTEVRINGNRISGLFHLYLQMRYIGAYNPLILTIVPNFLGHPSTLRQTPTWREHLHWQRRVEYLEGTRFLDSTCCLAWWKKKRWHSKSKSLRGWDIFFVTSKTLTGFSIPQDIFHFSRYYIDFINTMHLCSPFQW